ncbi:plasmid partition protein ParG [Clostridium perfringens]|nr:plasmid partition protein ParG [Clostridium perfringens]
MSENRFKSRQQKRKIEEELRLEQAKGASTPAQTAAKQNGNAKMVPVQFYMTSETKKRLKMYCLSNDTKMTEVLNDMVDEFLKSNGF